MTRPRAFCRRLRKWIGVDGLPHEPTLRTLGTGESQALPGTTAGITPQPAIANVSRSGLVTDQITALQNKADETLTALRAAGVIAP